MLRRHTRPTGVRILIYRDAWRRRRMAYGRLIAHELLHDALTAIGLSLIVFGASLSVIVWAIGWPR